jgi:hypothetical protein
MPFQSSLSSAVNFVVSAGKTPRQLISGMEPGLESKLISE